MPITSLYDETSPVRGGSTVAVPARAMVILIAGMSAAWIAAGSTGLLAHPLRHALTWIAMTVAICAGWPRWPASSRQEALVRWAVMIAGAVVGIVMTASNLPVINVLAVVVVLAALAFIQTGLSGRVVLLVTLSATVLALFRLACMSIPAVWLTADSIGGGMGILAGNITGQPLRIGATFAGLDFLVLMGALYTGWLIATTPPRLARAVYAGMAILAGQLVYLVALSFSPHFVSALPEVVMPPPTDTAQMGLWTWGNAARAILPWNLPLVAGVIQTVVAVVMFRWAPWRPVVVPKQEGNSKKEDEELDSKAMAIDALLRFGPILLAVAIPLLTALGLSRSNLQGKTIVAYDQGFLNWGKPEHDQQDTGMFGAVPMLVNSLGGQFVTSADLSEEDLREADVLLVIHPNSPWPEERLERVWQFVRLGGSLLVAAEPRRRQGELWSTFNEVLQPTGMRVRYDTAVASNRFWEQACGASTHPATAGLDDRRNQFGLVQASSIAMQLPARPLLVGQFAYSEPGSDTVETGLARHDPGEKLGDLVLAAEQRFGTGRIVVLGDASPLHNYVTPSAYLFTGRLLGYLANKPESPQALWRQLAGLLAMAGLIALLGWRASAVRIAGAAVTLAIALQACILTTHRAAEVIPDGNRAESPDNLNNIAYIDASHLEAYSSDTWGEFGVGVLIQALMRNGYLPLMLPELTSKRLDRADLLISIAPARRFSAADRQVIGQFVERGGTFICAAGAEAIGPSRELLKDFSFRVPPAPVPATQICLEPEPLGSFQQIYSPSAKNAYVQFHAGWPVECDETGERTLVIWSNGEQERPVITSLGVGDGTVVVVGDTYFATNQNTGAPDELAGNVWFWRWFLAQITDRPAWDPPAGEDKDEPAETGLMAPEEDLMLPEQDDAEKGEKKDEVPE